MSRRKAGSYRFMNNLAFFDDYRINAEVLKLEAVRVGGILPRNRKERIPDAIYGSLKEKRYKWELKVQCEFTADTALAGNDIEIENIKINFPEAGNQEYVLVPANIDFEWYGKRIKNLQQYRPSTAVGGSMRFKFWQDFHLFKIKELVENRDPDDVFWRAIRGFMGYRRILDERYRYLNMVMKVHVKVHGDVEDGVFFWHSRWDADETPFEIAALSERDSEKKRLVYTADSHWINGRDIL